ncbi:hypothetical protein EV361DRAFT_976193 [Lentinula raphanica]|nr:hypothetical protein EV361DRAFT_976193 [Lentinula raphanica]
MKMAAADAYARIHISPVANRGETLGVNEYLNHLRPKATAEFTSKKGPSFRSMHNAIHHVVWTNILQCFTQEVKLQYRYESLSAFGESKPSWDQLVKLSEQVMSKYIPDTHFHQRTRKPDTEHDFVFENLAIRNRDGLIYLGFARAINYGDVGRILQLFPFLIATFAAVGKHKFLTDLNQRYPPALREAILQNWLFNSKGTPDGFRPFDWLQELNNLYTKTIFSGEGPNHTRQLIFKRSVLGSFVSTFKSCTFKPGRLTSTVGGLNRWTVQDAVNEGFTMLIQKKELYRAATEDTDAGGDEETPSRDVDGFDVGVD